MRSTPSLIAAVFGATIYAVAGGVIGSMNAGWFGLHPNANALLPLLGVGAGLVIIAFASGELPTRLGEIGGLGLATKYLLVGGPALYVLSWAIEFAILGTLALGVGLVCLSIAVWRRRLVPSLDRILITFSAIGSLVWNTETVSAFLLVGVGFIWLILSVRQLSAVQR
ncbi:MAG: hypothetical protein ABR529_11535 [Actinomycetota bacterium]